MSKSRLLALLAITMVAGLLVTGCKNPMGLAPDTGIAWYWAARPEAFVLWAGKTINAGTVTIWVDAEFVYVKYDMAANWKLEETHVQVDDWLDGIPQRKGNPPPGQFEYGTTHNPRVQTYTYAIPLESDWDGTTTLYIATHAVAVQLDAYGGVVQRQTGWAGGKDFPGKNWAKYILYLPKAFKDVTLPTGTVKMRGTHLTPPPSYWDIELANVPSGYDVWNGHWKGWCAEENVLIVAGDWYDVKLWSTANPNLPTRCANAGWDNINYLLNHRATGAATGEIQYAIWYLLGEDVDYPTGVGEAYDRVRSMIDDAVANGDDWYPTGSGDWIAVILETAEYYQLCFIEVDP